MDSLCSSHVCHVGRDPHQPELSPNYAAHPHDAASRYWLAIPVFLLLQRLSTNVFSVLQFAFPAAAITGFLL